MASSTETETEFSGKLRYQLAWSYQRAWSAASSRQQSDLVCEAAPHHIVLQPGAQRAVVAITSRAGGHCEAMRANTSSTSCGR